MNGVTVDSGKSFGLAFQDVICGCEVVNSQNIKIHCQGNIPNLALDKSSSIQAILSKNSMNARIVTSKCDSINVSFPKNDDFIELPIPEQFVSKIKNGKLETKQMEYE